MTASSISQRNFLVTGTALAASPILRSEEPTGPAAARATANEFLSKWIQAWNHHDADQLGSLQHDLHSIDPIKFPFKTKWNTQA